MERLGNNKVTVITSTFNWSSVLEVAIKSVLNQSHTDFEYLIIGDACTDNSEEIVCSFNDPRIRWHNLKTNTGNQSNVNAIGLKMAKGDIIAYLNHDDIWFPDHLESMLNVFRKNNLDFLSSVSLSIAPDGFDETRLIGLPLVSPHGEISTDCMTSNVMHLKETALKVGSWLDWKTTEKVPTQEFFTRMRSHRGAHAILTHITAVKFHSGFRKNSYIEKNSGEQKKYFKLISEDPFLFRYKETLKSLSYMRLSLKGPKLVYQADNLHTKKGGRIESWRVRRGLDPMIEDIKSDDKGELMYVPQTWVTTDENGLTLVKNDPDYLLIPPSRKTKSPSLNKKKKKRLSKQVKRTDNISGKEALKIVYRKLKRRIVSR